MKIDRLLSLVIYLLNREQVTASQLAAHFETSIRTIYRDLDCLSLAGIPVTARQGSGGGISLMPQFRLDRQVFSSDELQALISAIQGVESALNDKSVTLALEKIKSLSPRQQETPHDVVIDFTAWEDPDRFRETLTLFFNAIKKRRVIRMEYQNLQNEVRERDIEPLRLFFKGSNWYLFAWCRSRKDFRFFRLSRMNRPVFTGEIFKVRELDLAQENLALNWPCSSEVSLHLRFESKDRGRLIGRFSDVQMVLEEDGFLHVKVQFPLDEWVYSFLLSMVDIVEIVEPQSVRQEILNRIHKFEKRNSNLTDSCQVSDGAHIGYCGMCEIRKCASEKKVDNCSLCVDFSCGRLQAFWEHAPEARNNLESPKNKNQ